MENTPPLDDATDAIAVKAWRKALRAQLIAQRLACTDEQHSRWSIGVTSTLREFFAGREIAGKVVAFCWPYNAEYDARPIVDELLARGALAALPVVVAPRTPLVFREWHPDAAMAADVYGIPVPIGTRELVPDFALVALNGFDGKCFRLGYGAGYFDRTLAALDARPFALGVGFEIARLPTIHPQPHDIAMDAIVTEGGLWDAVRQRET